MEELSRNANLNYNLTNNDDCSFLISYFDQGRHSVGRMVGRVGGTMMDPLSLGNDFRRITEKECNNARFIKTDRDRRMVCYVSSVFYRLLPREF